jgi:formylglycine-generating enzyme required for sulfatase activity
MKTFPFLATLAVVFSLAASAQTTWASTTLVGPVAGQPWTNSLGVKFVPAGTDGVLFSVWDVRVEDFKAFVDSTGYNAGWTWKGPGWTQLPEHPVVNVNWNDAHAFCDWLTNRERASGKLGVQQSYRLPTDAEWSVAVGLGDEGTGTPKNKDGSFQGVFPWGTQWPPPKGAGNYAELTRDGYDFTSPVGSFAPNKYGLYDMGGNVWQWCEDKYDPMKEARVLRGASWRRDFRYYFYSSARVGLIPDARLTNVGFRCVVVVSP